MTRIFLTGGNGFIGKNLIALMDRYDIDAPNRMQLDLANSNQVDAYFLDKQYDVIIHSASTGASRKCPKDPTLGFNENLRSFVNTFKHRDKSKRFIFLSSGAVYGRPFPRKITESYFEQTIPQDNYGLAKFV